MPLVGTDIDDDEVDQCVSDDRDDKTNDGVHDGILGASDGIGVTVRYSVAHTTNHNHDNGDRTNDKENHVDDCLENTSPISTAFFFATKETTYLVVPLSSCLLYTSPSPRDRG